MSGEEEVNHGDYSTMTDLCATTEARGNQMNYYGNMSMAKRTMPEEEINHGNYSTIADLCATNKARDNQMNYYGNMSMANRTTPLEDDETSVGTTRSAETVKRSNCSNIMPTKTSMMTRGAAWNVIKHQNWVQQTIADRDRRWCPTDIDKKLSPTDRIGAINKEYLGKLLDNKSDLTWACANSGCTATICIPGTPLKNL